MKSDRYGRFSLSTALVHGPAGCGKRTLIRRLADDTGISMRVLDLYKESEETFKTTSALLDLLKQNFESFDTVCIYGFELIPDDAKIRSIWHQISQNYSKRSLKLLACYSYVDGSNLPSNISDYFLESFDLVEQISEPGKTAVKFLMNEMLELVPKSLDETSCDDFVGFSISDFAELLEKFQATKNNPSFQNVFVDFIRLIKFRRSLKLDALEIPKVSWDEVAGLTEVKSVLKTLMENVQKHPRPTGILLHGPPGTGKTLIAKALATQSRFTLLPVKGPELLSPYIGESESSLRETFARAKSLSPCIIFFDELDALVPRRGDFGDSVGVADRLVATLMIEMDKISGLNSSESDNFVFVIGATNRPDLIDPALLRTGRFDQSILLDAPKTNKERAEILEASCRKLRCAPSIDFATPFEELEAGGGTVENFSPAQIASIAKCASKLVLERKLGQFRSNPDETELLIDPLTTSDLVSAAKELYLKEKTSFIFKSN